jgi:hypothetical protein
VLQQLRQPGGVTDVGLAAGEDLDMPGVDQQQLKACLLQHIPDGLPVLAGGLHHHLDHALGGQPIGQRLQPRGEGLEGPHLLGASTAPIGQAYAGHHLVLGDIQPGAAHYQQLHHRHLPMACGWCPAGPTESTMLKRVLTATVRGAGKAPASVLSTGSIAPRRAELGRATRFSSLVAAPGHGGLISNHALTAMQPCVFPGRA